jgi:hypothetical protein
MSKQRVVRLVLVLLLSGLALAFPAEGLSDGTPADGADAARTRSIVERATRLVGDTLGQSRSDPDCAVERRHRFGKSGVTVYVTGAAVGSTGSPAVYQCADLGTDAATVTFETNRAYVAAFSSVSGVAGPVAVSGSAAVAAFNLVQVWLDSMKETDVAAALQANGLLSNARLVKPGGGKIAYQVGLGRTAVVRMDNTLKATALYEALAVVDVFLTDQGLPTASAVAAIQSSAPVVGLPLDCLAGTDADGSVNANRVVGCATKMLDQVKLTPQATPFKNQIDQFSKSLSSIGSAIHWVAYVYQGYDWTRSHFEDGEITISVVPDGAIARADDGRAFLASGGLLRPIPDAKVWDCISPGRTIVRIHRDVIDDKVAQFGDQARCFTGGDVRGKIVRTDDGRSWYGDQRGWIHPIPDGGTFECLGGSKNVVSVGQDVIDGLPIGEQAACVRYDSGDIIRTPDGDAFLVERIEGRLARRPIVDGGGYECLVAQSHKVVAVPKYVALDLPAGPNASPVCLPEAIKNSVVTGPGAYSAYIDGKGTEHPIKLGGVYRCLTTWGGIPQYTSAVTQAQLDAMPNGDAAACNAHERARGTIVRDNGGHAVYVDSSLTAHNIQTTYAYDCLTLTGVRVIQVASHDWQEAFAYGPDQPGCEQVLVGTSGSSYYQDRAGTTHALVDTQSYYCYLDRGIRERRGLSQAAINAMPGGAAASQCLSPRRYANTMIRRSDGTVWVVDGEGRRRWVPDGFSYECYRDRGYRLVESNLNAAQAASLPEVGRMGFCLSSAASRNTLIRECGGTVYFVDGGGVRHWVRDGWTYERLQEIGYPLRSSCLNWEHIGSLPEGGAQRLMLAQWRVRNHVVRAPDGTAYFVTRDNVFHWIRTGDLYSWLVRRYGLAGTWQWEAINSIRSEGGWAAYW